MIAIITARAGSKRLPNKNVLDFHGFPLIHWTVEAAVKSQLYSDVYISTDCEEILSIYADHTSVVLKRRPSRLAEDKTSSEDVIIDLLNDPLVCEKGPKSFTLLQPTSPLRTYKHLQMASHVHIRNNLSPVISSTSKTIDEVNTHSLHRLEDFSSFKPNGAFYMCCVEKFIEKKSFYYEDFYAFYLNENSSIDIDYAKDFEKAEKLFELREI